MRCQGEEYTSGSRYSTADQVKYPHPGAERGLVRSAQFSAEPSLGAGRPLRCGGGVELVFDRSDVADFERGFGALHHHFHDQSRFHHDEEIAGIIERFFSREASE